MLVAGSAQWRGVRKVVDGSSEVPRTPVAITPYESMLRAALLFDEVVYPGFSFVNLDIDGDWLGHLRQRHANAADERDREFMLEVERLYALDPEQHPNALVNKARVRSLANLYVNKGRAVAFLYDRSFGEILEPGESKAYRAALDGLDIIDEKSLTLEQVNEFRGDAEARRKYRELHRWLNSGLQAASVEEAGDILHGKLDAYDWAIRKHGLKTVTGALHTLLDSRQLAAIAGGTGLGAMMAGPVWGAVAGGLLVGANVATWLADRATELEDVRRGQDSEIAIIYEARKQLA
jgi:hypothetical protein